MVPGCRGFGQRACSRRWQQLSPSAERKKRGRASECEIGTERSCGARLSTRRCELDTGVRHTCGMRELSQSATTMLALSQKPKGAANTTSKVRLKPKLSPSVTPTSVSDSFNQLHCVIELHEYSNIS